MYQTTYPDGNLIPAKLEFNLKKYEVTGSSLIEDMEGNKRTLMMKPFEFSAEGIKNEIELELIIRSLINSNRIEYKKIRGANISIFAIYENENLPELKKDFLVRNEIVSKSLQHPLTKEEIEMLKNEVWY